MARRSYSQYCALARAMDVVGDRWVLLIVRELLSGPKRFKELLASLSGIGPNLLTERLRELEAEGLVRRTTLPPPTASAVYDLTESGKGLESTLVELARWGLRFMGPRTGEEHFNPEWSVLALRVAFRPEEAAGVREEYEFRLDGVTLHARVNDGVLETALGPGHDPALQIETDGATFFLLMGGLPPQRAVSQGRLRLEGSPEALDRCLRLFSVASPRADAAPTS